MKTIDGVTMVSTDEANQRIKGVFRLVEKAHEDMDGAIDRLHSLQNLIREDASKPALYHAIDVIISELAHAKQL